MTSRHFEFLFAKRLKGLDAVQHLKFFLTCHIFNAIKFCVFNFIWTILCSHAGGAGSEVWNRVYMIAPVKKFGRVRLSTNFPWKQIWQRMETWKGTMSFCSVLSFPAYKYQEKVSMNFFNGPFGHQEA